MFSFIFESIRSQKRRTLEIIFKQGEFRSSLFVAWYTPYINEQVVYASSLKKRKKEGINFLNVEFRSFGRDESPRQRTLGIYTTRENRGHSRSWIFYETFLERERGEGGHEARPMSIRYIPAW